MGDDANNAIYEWSVQLWVRLCTLLLLNKTGGDGWFWFRRTDAREILSRLTTGQRGADIDASCWTDGDERNSSSLDKAAVRGEPLGSVSSLMMMKSGWRWGESVISASSAFCAAVRLHGATDARAQGHHKPTRPRVTTPRPRGAGLEAQSALAA